MEEDQVQALAGWVLEEDINMAFKFKVKKRPSMGQAVASAFAAGAIQGGTTALQNAMNERENRKKRSAQELNLFNNAVSGLPSTPDNLSKLLPIKSQIIKGQISGAEGLDLLGVDVDYQTEKQKQADIKAKQDEFANLSSDPDIVAAERRAKQSIGMVGLPATKAIEDVRKIETQIDRNVRRDPMQVNPNTIALMKKREIDISRNAVKDITKVIKDLEEKKQNAIALEGSDFAIPFTSQDQERLDTARAKLPEFQQRLSNALNQDSVTNVQDINEEPDPFEAYLDTSQ